MKDQEPHPVGPPNNGTLSEFIHNMLRNMNKD
jgi:hypothetical protein